MKKLKYFMSILFFGLIFYTPLFAISNSVFYTNQNGIEMTKKQYEKLLNSYTELEIAGFTQEQFEFEMEHNYQTVSSNTIFIQNMIKYDEFGEVEANIENILTEEEYENESLNVPIPYSYCGPTENPTSCWETSHKKITIVYQTVVDSVENPRVIVSNVWKNMPSRRSIDVIGIRVFPYTFHHRAIEARQTYMLNGAVTNEFISPSENYKVEPGGAMAAIQLPTNKSITALEEKLIVYGTFDYAVTGSNQGINGSYQHATGDVTLSAATNVTFSSSGMGGVFVFERNIGSFYDNTTGVSTLKH